MRGSVSERAKPRASQDHFVKGRRLTALESSDEARSNTIKLPN
jgi:hypothetical protein